MSRDDRRRLMDPQFVEKLRARLARQKIAKVSKDTERLVQQWENLPENWIERAYLRRQATAPSPPKEGQS